MLYYKMRPTFRQLVVIKFDTRATHSRSIMRKLRSTEEYLSNIMDDVKQAWDNRWGSLNTLPLYFGPEVRSCLDSFPVKVCRSKDSFIQSKCYNGKYGMVVRIPEI